jgi:hypothetical protein
MADETAKAKQSIKADEEQKQQQKNADKLHAEMVRSREASEKASSSLTGKLSENAKKQLQAFKNITKPSSMIKAVGLATGSPFVAIMGAKLGEMIDDSQEKRKEGRDENKKLRDLLKANGKSSKEIASILEDTADMSAENEDELLAKLSDLGIKDKAFFDKFLEIKKAGDERLIASNYDIVQQMKANGVDERDHAAQLREMLSEPEDQMQEQKDDEAAADRSTMAKGIEAIVNYSKDIANDIKGMAEELKKDGAWGLGTIAGLIAAPIIILIGFFQGLGSQLKWLKKFTGKGLGRIFKPFKRLIEGVKLFFGRITEFFSKILKFGGKGAKFGKAFSTVTKFVKGFGKILGKLFLPLQLIMGAFDFISGFLKGYTEGGFVEGLKQGVTSLFEGLVGGLWRMIAEGTAWVLDFLGFTNLATSIVESVNNLIEGFKGMFTGFVDLVSAIFSWDTAAMTTALTGIWESFKSIITAPLEMFIALIKDLFDFAGIELPEFDVVGYMGQFADDVVDTVKGWFNTITGLGDTPEEIAAQREAEKLALKSKSQAASNVARATRLGQEEAGGLAQGASVNTQNNAQVNNTSVSEAPNMSTGSDDASFAAAIGGI